MILNKIIFRGIEGYIIDDRIPANEKRDDLHYYHLRHSDEDFSEPCTIEDHVLINHWGTICFKESIDNLLEPWSKDRLSTDLTEEEVSAIWSAISEGEGFRHENI